MSATTSLILSLIVTTVAGARVEIDLAASAAAVGGCAGSTTAPLGICRGVIACANVSRPAASRALMCNTWRSNVGVFFAPRSLANTIAVDENPQKYMTLLVPHH